MNIFEKASRTQLRIDYLTRGSLMVEDLWQLPLQQLNNIAVGLQNEISAQGVSFIEEVSPADEETQLKFEIVKHIIEVKLAERKEAKARQDNAAKTQAILRILENKQSAALEAKSEEELLAELAALK